MERLSSLVARWAGSSWAFALACLSVILWAATGPWFDYSEGWQLVINTGTTIATFLMVFLLQRSQNKDTLALHLKLDELIRAAEKADDRLIGVERMPEGEAERLGERYAGEGGGDGEK